MSDAEIVSQVLAGNTARFEALLRKYAPMVRGLCASHVYDPSALDDLVQESFVAGYVNLHTLRDRRKFGPWIARITRNKCQSWLRQRVREERGQNRLQAEPLPNATPDPLSQLARKELCEWVRNQIGALPDKTREAMLLCYVEGLKIRETAEFLDASESSIKKRLQYGRDHLGEKLWTQLGELKRPATDDQPLCKKVMAALPLTSAPWHAGGITAAATGAATMLAGKTGVVAVTLAVLGIAFVAITWTNLPHRFQKNDAIPAAIAEAANINSGDDGSQAQDSSVNSVSTTPEGSGSLALSLYYKTPASAGINGQGKPIPVNGVYVWLAPKVFHREQMESALKDAGVPPDVIEALIAVNTHIHAPGGPEPGRKLTEADLRVMRERVLAASRKPGMGDLLARLEQAGGIGPEDTWVSGQSAPDGTLAFPSLASGPYKAYVRLTSEERPTRIPAENTTNTFDVYVQPDTANQEELHVEDTVSAIQGTLRDADTGEPIIDEPVQVSGDVVVGNNLERRTDEMGRFRYLPQAAGYGSYSLRVGGLRYAVQVLNAERVPGVPIDHQISMNRLATVSGHVYTYDGKPAVSATIFREEPARSGAEGTAYADETGFYSVAHDGGVLNLYASGTAAKSEPVTLELEPNASVVHDFILEPSANAYFDIRTPEGTVPEHFAKEKLIHDNATNSGDILKKRDDAYCLTYLTPGNYCLIIECDGYSPKVVEFKISEDLQDAYIPVLLDRAGANMTVAVVDERGGAVAGATVNLSFRLDWYNATEDRVNPRSESFKSLTTGDTGYAAFKRLPVGNYQIEVNGVREPATLPHTGVITIRVPSEDPAPKPLTVYLSKNDIELVDVEDEETLLSTEHVTIMTVTPSGEVGYNDLEIGDNLVYVAKSGYPLGTATVSISPERISQMKSAKVRVEIREGASVYGIVTKDDGTPDPGREIYVLPKEVADRIAASDGQRQSRLWGLGRSVAQGAKSSADGSFELPYLVEGDYYVATSPYNIEEVGQLVYAEAGHVTGPVNVMGR